MTSLRRFFVLMLAVAMAPLVGCATAAKPQAMAVQTVPAATSVNENLKAAMRVADVTGGKNTNPLWTSQVDAAGFKTALEQSLRVAGYMAPSADAARYVISANLKKLDQPILGLTFDVTSSIDYRVTNAEDTRNFPITATGSAGVGDAFFGVERLRLANENSINENIKAFLKALSNY